jgi:hypothetical protein
MILLFLFIIAIKCTIPECSWMCSDPICEADCTAVCLEPVCSIICSPEDTPGECNAPKCHTICPLDNQDPLSSCPSCETICEEINCSPIDRPCNIECEITQCFWKCIKPKTCPYPECQLQCQSASCEFSQSNKLIISLFLFILIKIVYIF